MRLIDADELLKDMDKELETCEDYGITPSWWTAHTIIKNQKTAYDVYKVVEQLEIQETVFQKYNRQKNDYECGFEDGCEFAFDKSVDIVKGGVNE